MDFGVWEGFLVLLFLLCVSGWCVLVIGWFLIENHNGLSCAKLYA